MVIVDHIINNGHCGPCHLWTSEIYVLDLKYFCRTLWICFTCCCWPVTIPMDVVDLLQFCHFKEGMKIAWKSQKITINITDYNPKKSAIGIAIMDKVIVCNYIFLRYLSQSQKPAIVLRFFRDCDWHPWQ